VDNSTFPSNTYLRAVRDGFNRLAGLLPRQWKLSLAVPRLEPNGRVKPDALWKLQAPDGTATTVVVETKSRFEPKDVPAVAAQLEAMRDLGEPLFIAPFISERAQSLLRERGISFLDTRGNLSIEFARPAVLLRAQGDTKPTEPSKKPRRSLRGPITERVVRFLCDYRPPLGVRKIAKETNVSAGGVSRILDFLDRESYVTRNERGVVMSVDWKALLRRWSDDLSKEREQQLFFQPRGLKELQSNLLVAQPSEAFVYVCDVQSTARALDLKTSETATNVRLVEAYDRVVFERTTNRGGLTLTAPSQILPDLLNTRVRSRDEIDAFEEWMEKNQDVWRRD
jgi:hypothetical protein